MELNVRRASSIGAATAIALFVGGLSTPPAAGTNEVPVADRPVVIDGRGSPAALTPGELEDAVQLAKDSGESLRDVQAGLVGQAEFAELVADLATTFPDSYAGAEWIPPTTGPSVIHLVGSIPDEVTSLALASSLNIRLDPHAAISESAALAQQASAYAALYEADGVANVIGSLDTVEGVLDFEVQPDVDSTVDAHDLLDLLAARERATGELTMGVEMEIIDVPFEVGRTEAIRGGMNHGGCTAAFTVKSGSTWGVSTAQHCSPVTSYDGASMAAGSTRASAKSEGDGRWTPTTGTSASSSFRYTFSGYRNVTSVVNPTAGMNIRAFGIGLINLLNAAVVVS
ncbi:S1 family peptidase [Microbacterium marinum]|uniref:hypothetical protein n=1 Tax=Microbacterium marinum TaxID=421115 RepID=UPI0038517F56